MVAREAHDLRSQLELASEEAVADFILALLALCDKQGSQDGSQCKSGPSRPACKATARIISPACSACR